MLLYQSAKEGNIKWLLAFSPLIKQKLELAISGWELEVPEDVIYMMTLNICSYLYFNFIDN